MSRRTTLLLGLECTNRCIFCALAAPSLPRSQAPRQSPSSHLAALRERYTAITFTGGEPLLHELAPLVRAAKELGFTEIGVQTNGHALGDPGVADELSAAGLTDVQLSLHGADARAHDYHTGIDGSFDRVLRAMDAARAAELTVAVVTVLTRSSFRGLAALPPLLRARGTAAWLIELPRIAGRAEMALDRVVPRLGLAVPFALHALEAARALGIPTWIRGAPLCTLGPLAARDAHLETETPRAYPEAKCGACEARTTCSGLDPIYLARYGDGELHPIDAVRSGSPAASPPPDSLLPLFAGIGPLAPPLDRAEPIHPPPAEVRRRLPMLGKVQPAAAEVPRSQPRRTGEALRQIFPDLFADTDRREPKPDQ